MPFPVEVNLKVTVPAAISAALGVYVVVKSNGSANPPGPPEVVQNPPVATVTLPVKMTSGLAWQTVSLGPASTFGLGV